MSSDLIAAVREHGRKHREDGWDILDDEEAFPDSRLAEIIGKARTPKGAIAKVAAVVADAVIQQGQQEEPASPAGPELETGSQPEDEAAAGTEPKPEAGSEPEPGEMADDELDATVERLLSGDSTFEEEVSAILTGVRPAAKPAGEAQGGETDGEAATEDSQQNGLCDCGKWISDCGGSHDTAEGTADGEKYARERKPEEVDQKTGEVLPGQYALADVQMSAVTVYKGRIKVCTPNEDGGEDVDYVDCPHQRYGHESEQAAQKCARSVASKRGLKVR